MVNEVANPGCSNIVVAIHGLVGYSHVNTSSNHLGLQPFSYSTFVYFVFGFTTSGTFSNIFFYSLLKPFLKGPFL